jgi:ferric-dicitrate binding protein FerR (iron transport regulator)
MDNPAFINQNENFMEKNLKHTDDFLLDDDFHEYIMEPSQQRERKWAVFFEKNPETRTEAEKAKKIIIGLTSFKDSTSENEINEFHLLHNFERAFKSYRESKSKKTFVTASKWVWRSVAAAAVIVFMVTSYALVTHYIDKTTSGGILSEIYVPAAKQSQLTLPDGSVVWINSDTKIKYSNRFNTKERNIYLDGEAYFEVAPNQKLPFRVFSSGTEVRALGTKFNVKAYPADKQVETVLLEGKIEFRRTESAKSRVIALQPGDKNNL